MGALQKAAAGQPVTPDLAAAAAAAGAPGPEAAPTGAPPAGPAPEAGAPPAGPAPAPTGAPPAGPAPTAAAPGGTADAGAAVEPYMQQADPQQQQEYERAIRAMAKVLYANDKTANAIVDQITPNDLVGSTSKVAMLFIKELDRKVNMDESVIATVTQETVERIAELAEARHSVSYQPTDIEKILGATWEGVQSMFGNEDVEGYTQTVQGMRPEDLATIKSQHEAILSQAK